MKKYFESEGAEFAAYIASNPDHALIRYGEGGVMVLTGADKDDYEAGGRVPSPGDADAGD